MRYIEDEGRIVWSASDLKAAAECEFAWLRAIDARLDRVVAVEEPEDLTLDARGSAGDRARAPRPRRVHRAVSGTRVVVIPEARSSDRTALAAAVEQTNRALASDAAVVYQAAFATTDFVGLRGLPGARRRRPMDRAGHEARSACPRHRAHAARGIRRSARSSGRRLAPTASSCSWATGASATHDVDDLLPVFELRRARLLALIADRRLDLGAAGEPIAWGDPRGDLGRDRVRAMRDVRRRGRGIPRSAARRGHAPGSARAAARGRHRDHRAARRGRRGARRDEPRHVRDAAYAGATAAAEPRRHPAAQPAEERTCRGCAAGAGLRGRRADRARRAAATRPRRHLLRLRGRSALHGAPCDPEGESDPVGHRLPLRLGRREGAVHARCGRTRSPRRSARSRPSSTS